MTEGWFWIRLLQLTVSLTEWEDQLWDLFGPVPMAFTLNMSCDHRQYRRQCVCASASRLLLHAKDVPLSMKWLCFQLWCQLDSRKQWKIMSQHESKRIMRVRLNRLSTLIQIAAFVWFFPDQHTPVPPKQWEAVPETVWRSGVARTAVPTKPPSTWILAAQKYNWAHFPEYITRAA